MFSAFIGGVDSKSGHPEYESTKESTELDSPDSSFPPQGELKAWQSRAMLLPVKICLNHEENPIFHEDKTRRPTKTNEPEFRILVHVKNLRRVWVSSSQNLNFFPVG